MTKTAPSVAFVTRVHLVAASLLAVHCSPADDCSPSDLRIGERYRVTIIERIPWLPEYDCDYLQPGDEFTVTIFSTKLTALGCERKVVAPEVPNFLPDDVLWNCGGASENCVSEENSLLLGLRTTGPGMDDDEAELTIDITGPPERNCADKFRVSVVWEDR